MSSSDRWQIHRYLARNTDERLQLVRHVPQQIVLVGADADESRSLLAARYPKAVFTEYDPRPDFLEAAAQARKSGLWQKLTGKKVVQHCQAVEAALPEAAADMLWANLALITAKEPVPVFENWARALKTNGLLFFTHFGIDTLSGLTGRLKKRGIAVEAPMLFDMHDLGDMLFHHGFYDPVMDTAKLELHYRRAETFWQDMDTLGLWASLVFDDEAAAREAVEAVFAEEGELTVTLETVYGHAVKKLMLPQGESPVQFYPKKPQ
ncbi:MAG: methyltransferase domain-containing protein [Neisseria zoodegmatis]|uniref:methyltransferase domain-containing protein n=1 Tax=Neisseria zoodegmatis TaxID=326523 RepID=UPI0026EF8B7C|nr:methyltransferase domain-containing protein [Neisseria zoodegmatis]MDO5069682.1 methyltransferase domain-containing protein [Neisseria zoodegmatis]